MKEPGAIECFPEARTNRYYDPATGQFTQPAPIGLAGGLNSYGFAAGDPVSYDDPYGLCPKVGRLAPAMAADGPVPAVDIVLGVACVVELGAIGLRWYRGLRAAEAAVAMAWQAQDDDGNFKTPETAPDEFTKLRGSQGHRDPRGNNWKKDRLHKDHWDLSDNDGNKIRKVDFSGREIWPNGPKNRNKQE